jgi:DNA-binding response OmpR family regulator
LLEDDEILCALLSQRLEELGLALRSFHEPRALEWALARDRPDLLLLDVMLPGRSGTEVLAGLRQQGHRFPVLMLSALRSAGDRIAGLEAGADDYMGKPFEFRELQLRIERLLSLSTGPLAFPPPPHDTFLIGSLRFEASLAELRTPEGSVSRISRGDAALLQALCRRPGEVVGRQSLARVSGSLVDPSLSRSIDVRLGRLRRLLCTLLPEAGEVIETRRGEGYRLLLPVTRPVDC